MKDAPITDLLRQQDEPFIVPEGASIGVYQITDEGEFQNTIRATGRRGVVTLRSPAWSQGDRHRHESEDGRRADMSRVFTDSEIAVYAFVLENPGCTIEEIEAGVHYNGSTVRRAVIDLESIGSVRRWRKRSSPNRGRGRLPYLYRALRGTNAVYVGGAAMAR